MKPDSQRIAIATACGWTDIKVHANGYMTGTRPRREMEDEPQQMMAVPLYPASLDAMHEAEKVLTEDQGILYRHRLAMNSDGGNAPFLTVEAAMCHATAAQRAEALLKTLGLWKEGE